MILRPQMRLPFLLQPCHWFKSALDGSSCENPVDTKAKKGTRNLPEVGIFINYTLWQTNITTYGKSPFLMGTSTINGPIFNSYVSLPEGKCVALTLW